MVAGAPEFPGRHDRATRQGRTRRPGRHRTWPHGVTPDEAPAPRSRARLQPAARAEHDRRDPARIPEQVRAPQGERADPAGPAAVQRGLLPGQLQLRPAHAGRRRRSARRRLHGDRPDLLGVPDRGAPDRPVLDGGREEPRREAARGACTRPPVRRLPRARGCAAPLPPGDGALLHPLPAARGEAHAHRGVAAPSEGAAVVEAAIDRYAAAGGRSRRRS